MFHAFELDNQSDEDQCFISGFMLSQYQSAIDAIKNSLAIIAASSLNEKVEYVAVVQADTALITLGNIDFDKLKKPDVYYEISPYIADKLNVRLYISIRKERMFKSHDDEMELLINSAINKLI